MIENSIEAQLTNPTHRAKDILRLAGRYLRPVFSALLLIQTLALPVCALAEVKNSSQEVSNEYLVDVIIHRSLPQQQAEDWVKDAVDNYLNRRFAESGTSKRFRTDQIIRDYDEKTGCSMPGAIQVYDRCEFNDGKIRVWLYQKDFRYGSILTGTSANPVSASVQTELPFTISVEQDGYFGQRVHGDQLLHEVGHVFGIPDYYEEDVNANLNLVAPVGIIPFARDVMHNNYQHHHFSDTSRNYIERVDQLPIGFGEPHWEIQFTPKQTILRITDDEDTPLNGVKVESFPQRTSFTSFNEQNLTKRTIPNIPSLTGYTDELGQFNLDPEAGPAVFLRVTYNDEARYAAITRSYLNHLYFQGYTDTALVSVVFSTLHVLGEGSNRYLTAPGIFVEF
ncbi:MAG: hypothetical protein UU73_C0003G0233 [Candidatus Daviesbacteria bacterium GW2011_GWA1_41_61]|uniref:Uncharacterized protein n=1 Tax=Candidatus Daviesbacteria bacterium GW2011_GWA2_40_9 TaxID=1618424 RepID=A0A0G0U3Z3_9BACT|nr:MAG: hypothetical protein UU26_C0027G0003 [Candidatus Daviesbacteria bacterium GW2011_GWC1_40_9]KKR83808.1 MAG: hypothetical protein UU29_C0001G0028 [Candidatus Daviesbacteria bacterium GW2011_GWA2_40_9]KKR93417.1 MAG: hypothetical protein UU44_C0002G0078 [Candidatus Daviesbacteria bacterium GW2011_GWB1_41_15]KKS15034.1 MAG: hypothetical protein UU73_C0003G0233 [Candidatus Daviesbacteria bacterium GW2011_GWA1_41_61]